MKTIGTLIISLFLTVVAITTLTNSSLATPQASSESLIVEFPVPGGGDPFNIILQEPGISWFTMPETNAVGKLEVVSTDVFTVTTFPLSTPNSEPYDLSFDGTSIWFTQKGSDQIGEIDVATGVMTETAVSLPANSNPTGIDIAPDGTLWFTLQGTDQLGHYSSSDSSLEFFTYTITGGNFEQLEVATNNVIWFSASGLNRLVKYTVDSNTFTSVNVADSFGGDLFPPGGFTLDSGQLWVSAPTKGWLGLYSPGTATYWFWKPTPLPEYGPTDIASRQNGDIREIWYVAPTGNMAGYMFVDDDNKIQAQLKLGLPTQNSNPTGIVIDGNGYVWIAENEGGNIALWKPPYAYSTYLPLIVKSGD